MFHFVYFKVDIRLLERQWEKAVGNYLKVFSIDLTL